MCMELSILYFKDPRSKFLNFTIFLSLIIFSIANSTFFTVCQSTCLFSFLEVHILSTTCKKAFILAPKIPCRVTVHSTTSNHMVHAGGGGGGGGGVGTGGQNLIHIQKIGVLL